MERYVFASHGSLATGMKSAVEMIAGKNESLQSYDLEHYASPDEILSSLSGYMDSLQEDEFVIFTDLFGGSVNTKLMSLAARSNAILVSGMSLGLVLAVILGDKSVGMMERISKARTDSVDLIRVFDKTAITEMMAQEAGDDL